MGIGCSAGPPKARPVLKWVGGKTQLLPDLLERIPDTFGTYHEPFVGGGALFFELAARGMITSAVLSDVNASLIDVYVALRDDVEAVIGVLRQHRHEASYYYMIRSLDPKALSLPERAARTLYLNKTCYNGLHRENRAGQFNVPFGSYKNPTICDEGNLRAASRVLQGVKIDCRSFAAVLEVARPGDFVYLDPPYHPVSLTANFTSYDRSGFGEQEQRQLSDVFCELGRRGTRAMLSNSDTAFVRALYAGYPTSRVYAARPVNSKGGSRGKVAEVIVCSYEPPRASRTLL